MRDFVSRPLRSLVSDITTRRFDPVWRLSTQVTRFTVRRLNLCSSRERVGLMSLLGDIDCNRREDFWLWKDERYRVRPLT